MQHTAKHINFARHQPGFGLIECLVYFLLLSLLTIVTFNWMIKTQSFLKKQSQKSSEFMSACAAQDLLVRELRAAPAQLSAWKKISATELIWQGDGVAIGWGIEDKNIVRSEGVYSADTQSWGKRSKSIVCSSFSRLNFNLQKIQKNETEWINSITISFNENSTLVAIRNGEIA